MGLNSKKKFFFTPWNLHDTLYISMEEKEHGRGRGGNLYPNPIPISYLYPMISCMSFLYEFSSEQA